RRELDVTDPDACRRLLASQAPDAVAHCAAYTDVDGAEGNPPAALEVNARGAGHVARAATEVGSLLLYPGTDYVFDGESEDTYTPDDPPRPINAYGRSKLAGERAVREAGAPWLIVRTSWLYGRGGRSFVDLVRERAGRGEELRVVDDQAGRPTWTGSLAPALVELLERGPKGPGGELLHLADRGTTTWYGLAREVIEREGLKGSARPVSTEEWGAPAPRPRNAVLDIATGEAALGRPMPHWTDSLGRYLERGRS
nr:dTDP-4-dehydrorhamnose reductase [Gemmatimonadota bacterium]NIR77709.1 dTDP-4-dehydrorhamnose reductase [Gemmatimonadota bacterium]NIT86253.1 dTDP-4-dehydrorhamnose reductase [Gemmatimonadota bacterium]NIU30081.1 dTDP-4-dehydrorhamnose reductase [Gemmatimonadota bacterium]NIU35032.1 dTDP-4-dehydrorhamnose reductase [Gemmatimonadota bacterium]